MQIYRFYRQNVSRCLLFNTLNCCPTQPATEKNMRSAKKFPPLGRTFRTNVIVTFVNIMTCNVPPMTVFLSMNQLMKEKNKSINNKTTNKNGKAI